MERLRLATTLPADPADVYQAWISGTLHAEMTGAPAMSEPKMGGAFTAWDGYITGTHLVLEPGKRIVQTWRTTEFPVGAPDSTLELRLSKAGRGSRLALLQSDIPDGQSDQYAEGWVSHYFDPMTAYFTKTSKARPKKKTPKKTAKRSTKKAARASAKPAKRSTKKAARASAPKKKPAKRSTKKVARPAKAVRRVTSKKAKPRKGARRR